MQNITHIADFVENIFDAYSLDANLVCELACGTGNITIPLAKRGYDMIALDNSYDMLEIARRKAEKLPNILFLNQNMVNIDLYGTVDAFICLIDGIIHTHFIKCLNALKIVSLSQMEYLFLI